MAADIPTKEPFEIRAGDTVKWKKAVDDYRASDGWTLKYSLRGNSTTIDLTSTAYVVSDTGNNYPNSGDVVMYQDGGGTYRCATVGTESLYAANDGDIDMTGFSNCSDCQMYSGE